MKHAFLIIAHQDFEILSILLKQLDDCRNDLFIHLDKKVKIMPKLSCQKSRLFFVQDDKRINVRWGDITQIEAELALFDLAKNNGSYSFYHMISGVHLTLVNQDDFHFFFDSYPNHQVFTPLSQYNGELEEKGNMINPFMKRFNDNRFIQILRRIGIKFQKISKLRINKDRKFSKASNWVSISEAAVIYILERKKEILKRYKFTMCGDELFIPTELSYSELNFMIIYSNKLLFQEFKGANARVFSDEDVELVLQSNCLFARKFSSSHIQIVEKILDRIKS
ncbi:glycosyl transferase [Sphingobacterium mizutaii NBRC 14946 = DSM 11724]|uniref:Peptide O-xylosyltransferase n=2 Tax=Sphingobacterium mizutaii TaxID=1010 RepID=A0AAJ5C0J9_9SPHI|nr:beta-1,6-N-acetylglucosaminyltransferase [Sphingobacterium mizutaii]GEM68184.1 glycosyl transferase [Sphingobacterium mizutaii NBRC 14946 = DSM 11724]SDL09141.1 Core-2/I-Branching enzyme [Sphingobacterium mizutaii]SNV51338.1 Core-2/I-Branching enzyme [Sphingobacterium mizutaii]